MTDHRFSTEARRDRGFTLPEILVAMMVSGILVSALAMAFSVIVRSQTGSQQRIAESKDVTFVQTWLPTDLSSATQTWIEPQLPFPFNADLPGTNVVTLARPDLATGGAYLIMYRYEELEGRGWIMARYRVDNPGCPTDFPVVGNCSAGPESVKRVGVAYELVPPPPGWSEDQAPTHAIEVTRRNGGSTYGAGSESRPVGEDVAVHFKSGTIYIAGGSGLSAGQAIDPNPQEIPDPVAPPSRCGRRILILVDQSGSISNAGAQQTVKDAVTSFVQGFQGTPGQIAVNGFGNNVKVVSGPYGTYLDTLNNDSVLNNLVNTTIQNLTFNEWTNWHAGIQSSYAIPTSSGDLEYHDYVPDMVVFISDGDPTRHLTSTGQSSDSPGTDAYNHHASFAATSANLARELGVQDVIGVLVGDPSSASVDRLASVVGGTEWNGEFPGNAEVADYFAGSFSELGGIVRSLTARECGGALTIQKRFNDSTNPSTTGVWEYQSEQGSKVLDYGSNSSVTFQHEFQTGETVKEFWIEEQPRAGWIVDRVTCKSRGVDVPASRIVRTDPATAGDPVRFTIDLEPDEALSCFVWSDPA